MSDSDSWNDGPYLFHEDLDVSHTLQDDTSLLRQDLRELRMRAEALEINLAQAREQLEEESLRRGIIELHLKVHQEALQEKTNEVKELHQTIETQNCLLGLAWADSQNMASSRRETEKAMEYLHDYVRDTFAAVEEAEGHVRKKRRLGP